MTRTLEFRYVIMRNGADFGQLYPLSAPTIRCDSSADIKTSLSGTFLNNDEVNWLSDEIRVEMIIDGVVYLLGVYLPATVTFNSDGITDQVDIEAYDRCWIVQDNKTESLIYFQAGTNYLTAINQLLAHCGIALVTVTPNLATMAEDREDWPVGTSYLEIINQLLSEINYKQLWFDKSGTAVLEPISVPTANNISHTMDNSNVKSMMLPKISRETDVYSAPNVFICICSNADKNAPMTAVSENTNPQSPLSIARRGRRIATVFQVNNIADQAELQAYADTLRNNSMISGETIGITTGLLPDYGVADVVGLIYDGLTDVCIDKAWDMTLDVGGEMTHTLERVVVNLG